MKYPNRIQAALLLDARFEQLDAVTRDFARIAEMKSGATFSTSEHHPGAFARLFDGEAELMLTFEYVASPPDTKTLEGSLTSPVTTIRSPDMAERIDNARSHILLEVSQGTLGGVEFDAGQAALIEELDARAPGANAEAFAHRLATLALMVRVATDHVTPSAIHWTQSDQLMEPEAFEAAIAKGFPGPLAIHPMLYSEGKDSREPGAIGLRTFGARHWLGAEIHVPPSVLPWSAAYETVLAFCAAATSASQNDIPAPGAPFEPDHGGEIWRVEHHEDPPDTASDTASDTGPDTRPSDDPVAAYELIPLRHDACAFLAEEYAREADVLCHRTPKSDKPRSDLDPDPHTGSEPPPDTASPAVDALPEPEDHSHLAELEAALAEGLAEAAANPPEPLPTGLTIAAPSQPGELAVSGRSLRARVFGAKDPEGDGARDAEPAAGG
ncbi:MAG: hypothetical protein AAGH57_00330 [Pseudomonadota bacterium]